ncbi:MAG: 2Fe-2S iron-sulfur cluster binding domain-containing protein [Gammaproteobacteria bacterium]|nr:2Fe-2S iron-sulfur cluster binding domain-containing protein [Gammaproteobacteria bacterium]
MPKIKVTNLQGEQRSIDATPGLSLMEVLRDNNYEEILAMCGGCCSCATCHVHIQPVEEIALPIMEEDEELLLEMADHYDPKRSRLSCQIELTEQHDGLEVTLVEVE